MIEIQSDMQITVKAPQIQLQATGPLQLQGNPVQIDGGSAVTVSGAVINLG
jgi:phage gp45-like